MKILTTLKTIQTPKDGTIAWIRAIFRAILAINIDKNIKKSDNITICLARHEMVVCNKAIYRWAQRHQKLKDGVGLTYTFSIQTRNSV